MRQQHAIGQNTQVQGFTLAELLLVITIISTMSFFVVKNYAQKTRQTLVSQASATVLDIKRASLAFFVQTGTWPDQHNNCHTAGTPLQAILGTLSNNPWGFEYEIRCPLIEQPFVDPSIVEGQGEGLTEFRPSLQIRQQVSSALVARQLAGRLPSSEVQRQGQRFYVVSYVPMALLPAGTDYSNQVSLSGNRLTFRTIICTGGQAAQALLMPSEICINSAQGLFGFRLTTRNIDRGRTQQVLFDIQDGRGRWVSGFTACPAIDPQKAVRIYQYCSGS